MDTEDGREPKLLCSCFHVFRYDTRCNVC